MRATVSRGIRSAPPTARASLAAAGIALLVAAPVARAVPSASDSATGSTPTQEPASTAPSPAAAPTRAATAWPVATPGDALKGAAVSDFPVPAAKLPIRPKIKEGTGYPIAEPHGFRLSFYWLAYETEYAYERYDTDVYDQAGEWLGRYPHVFVFELVLEGTGVLRDGRVLNYDGHCPYGVGTCFAVLDPKEHPLGRGVQGRRLEPFRSVAVDPRYIPIGAPLYVPEIVGMQLPDGTLHDGCLRADDQGGAIKQHKLDFFVESYFNFKFLADQLWWRLKATPHLDEPRCEYLRVGDPRERWNEMTDWALIHSAKWRRAVAMKARAHGKRRPGGDHALASRGGGKSRGGGGKSRGGGGGKGRGADGGKRGAHTARGRR